LPRTEPRPRYHLGHRPTWRWDRPEWRLWAGLAERSQGWTATFSHARACVSARCDGAAGRRADELGRCAFWKPTVAAWQDVAVQKHLSARNRSRGARLTERLAKQAAVRCGTCNAMNVDSNLLEYHAPWSRRKNCGQPDQFGSDLRRIIGSGEGRMKTAWAVGTRLGRRHRWLIRNENLQGSLAR